MMSYYSAPGQQQQYPIVQQQQQQPMYAAGYAQPQPVLYQQPGLYQQHSVMQQPRPVSPVAHSTSPVPHSISPVPHSTSPVPHSTSPVPHSTSPVPHSTSPVPHVTGAAPSTPSAPSNQAQVNAIATLRQRISAESAVYPPDVMSYCTDGCLSRYLRARDWDIEAAYKMLKASLDWRATYKPHLITEAQIQGPLKIGTMFFSGFDRQNRPVIYVKPGAQSGNSVDERIMYVTWLMEHVTSSAAMGADVEQVMIIMDFSEFGKRAKSPDSRQTAQAIINILQNHYPERLGAAIVINSPWYFNLLFKMMSPFINANTKKKMAWITGDHQQIFTILSQSIDPSQLLTIYGGSNGNYPAGEAHN